MRRAVVVSLFLVIMLGTANAGQRDLLQSFS
jgi:hypothetical protein